MNQSKHYTANDIERYHSGLLSAAEMNALEKAALDDPFLADALDGYAQTKTPASDLIVLQQRLQKRIGKDEKQKRLFYIGNNWMRVAALFILFIGGGWIIYQTLSKTEDKNDHAVAIDLNAKKPTPVTTPPSADSASVFSDAPENSKTLTYQQRKSQPEQKNDMAVQKSVSAPVAATGSTNFQHDKTESNEQANQLTEAMASRRQDDSITRGHVTASAFKKERESFAPQKTDTLKNVNVVLQRTEVAADETIVLKGKVAAARSRNMLVIDSLEPAEGWTNFDDYISSNLKAPEELKSKPAKGEVELSFEVNKNGEPVNIAVVKSLCEKCDEEAIRLLKEGPKWKNKNKRGKIKIKF